MRKVAFVSALALSCLALGAGASLAQQAVPKPFDESTVAGFYRGRTVRIVVGFVAGGGFDAYSRLIGRHLGKYIPGNPTVIVENMPGVGSIIAANHVYNAGAKDGAVIGNISGPIILEQLFDNPAVRFDMAKFRHLAVPVSETYLLIVTRKAGVTRFEELVGRTRKQVVVGAVPGSTLEHAALLVRDALGANLKVVSGYKGTAEVRLAMDSGEVGGFFNTWTSAKIAAVDKLRDGEWVILAQLTDTPLVSPLLPRAPTIPEIAKNEEQRQLLRFGTSVPNVFGKLYVMAPDVPPDRAAAVEGAFMKTLVDKDFLAEAEKGRFEIGPLYGDQIHKLVLEFLEMPPDLKSKLQALTNRQKK
jgi:tripartite-type tricarboxylate transporter receptor subunit TctC